MDNSSFGISKEFVIDVLHVNGNSIKARVIQRMDDEHSTMSMTRKDDTEINTWILTTSECGQFYLQLMTGFCKSSRIWFTEVIWQEHSSDERRRNQLLSSIVSRVITKLEYHSKEMDFLFHLACFVLKKEDISEKEMAKVEEGYMDHEIKVLLDHSNLKDGQEEYQLIHEILGCISKKNDLIRSIHTNIMSASWEDGILMNTLGSVDTNDEDFLPYLCEEAIDYAIHNEMLTLEINS